MHIRNLTEKFLRMLTTSRTMHDDNSTYSVVCTGIPTNQSQLKAQHLFPLISATDHICSSLTGYRRLIKG
jgi:hypothetical protein